uniref:Pulmonary surfactant-associated protein B n=1 Tax=Noccaea caerulescens TaxID=107243 RepID=A0A1J3HT93_NOCCA
MGGKFGDIVLFFFFCFFLLGLTWSCDARNPILLEPSESGGQVCELCEKYATLAIEYLGDDDNQKALVEALHTSCSQIPPLQKQCLSMVDHYTQLFFTQVSVIKSDQICTRLNLCRAVKGGLAASQGNCEACRQTVTELVTQLKDPETKLKIIRLLLKECKSLNNYQDKCKKMVFEYGPVMLVDLDKFLENKDVCTILRVCPAPPTTHLLPYALDTLADS